MRILIMGGTAFVGRHIAQAALGAGHDVTLFHRGQTGRGLFPAATEILGDRNDEAALAQLSGGSNGNGAGWDATVDVSAYLPRQVRALASALGGRGGQATVRLHLLGLQDPGHARLQRGRTAERAARTRVGGGLPGELRRAQGGLRAAGRRAVSGRARR